jgi:hypothetical protein
MGKGRVEAFSDGAQGARARYLLPGNGGAGEARP